MTDVLPTLGTRAGSVADAKLQGTIDDVCKAFSLMVEADLDSILGSFGILTIPLIEAGMIKVTVASPGFKTLNIPTSLANERIMVVWNADASETITIGSGTGGGTTTTLAPNTMCWVYYKGNDLVKIM